MTTYLDMLDEFIGPASDIEDINVAIVPLFKFAFDGFDICLWPGQGPLFSIDGTEWIGTVDENDRNLFEFPAIQDGRDGSSPDYSFTVTGFDAEVADQLDGDETIVRGRPLTIYRGIVVPGEGLRPRTPLHFRKQLTMISARMKRSVQTSGRQLVRTYSITVMAKDGNVGRAAVPGGTFTAAGQSAYAAELGVAVDKGGDYVAGLSNLTLTPP